MLPRRLVEGSCALSSESKHDGSDASLVNSGGSGLIVAPALAEVSGVVDHRTLDHQCTKLAARIDTKHEFAMGRCAQAAAGPDRLATLCCERGVTRDEAKNLADSKTVGESGLGLIGMSTSQREDAAAAAHGEVGDQTQLGMGDLDIADGSLYSCMKIIPDPQLRAQLENLCVTVARLHAGGVFHRDIKLGNILAFNDSGTWTLKLCDFGMAVCIQQCHGHRPFNPAYFDNDVGFGYYLYPWTIVPDVWPTSMYCVGLPTISQHSLTLLHPMTQHSLHNIRDAMLRRLGRNNPGLSQLLLVIDHDPAKRCGQEFVGGNTTVSAAHVALATQCDWFSVFLVLAACIHVFDTPRQREALRAFGMRCLAFEITSYAQALHWLSDVFPKDDVVFDRDWGEAMDVDS